MTALLVALAVVGVLVALVGAFGYLDYADRYGRPGANLRSVWRYGTARVWGWAAVAGAAVAIVAAADLIR